MEGLITSPTFDGSFDIKPRPAARPKRVSEVKTNWFMPAGTEFLDMTTHPQYIALVGVGCDRRAKPPSADPSRSMASGCLPVSLQKTAPMAMCASRRGGEVGVAPAISCAGTKGDASAIAATTGTGMPIILRGGQEPNYDRPRVESRV